MWKLKRFHLEVRRLKNWAYLIVFKPFTSKTMTLNARLFISEERQNKAEKASQLQNGQFRCEEKTLRVLDVLGGSEVI